MAHLRARKWSSRNGAKRRFYVVTEDGRERPAGTDLSVAKRLLSVYEEKKRLRQAGIIDPPTCAWTLADLAARELEDANRRGMDLATRRKVWRAIFSSLGATTPIAAIRPALIGNLAGPGLSAGTINRRRALLSKALAYARSVSDESGYTANPFAGLSRLSEKDARKPRALTREEAVRLLSILPSDISAWAELQLLTASRPGEVGERDGQILRYRPHKRGRARSFLLVGRLAEVWEKPRRFSRALWARATEELGMKLRPHDLRHTALTWAGEAPGASLVGMMRLGGWTTPGMASRYLHPTDDAMDAVLPYSSGQDDRSDTVSYH